MKKIVGVYGAGGCGRGILPLVRARLMENEHLVFIDDSASGSTINGHEVWGWQQFLGTDADHRAALLAVANSQVRQQLDEKCQSAGVQVAGVMADNVVTMDEVSLGEGALISPFATLTSNISIGRCFHANLYSYVEHDCLIGNYVTFAPGVHCNGNVQVGDHAYIGAGAMIRQGIVIGSSATVGMGAVVTKDVADGETVVGNPADR